VNARTKKSSYGDPNGILPIRLDFYGAWHELSVIGGPFDFYRPGHNADIGVCVRAERIPPTADYRIPIEDFSIPRPEQRELIESTIIEVLRATIAGKRVWVGCMGGYGRTGIFMAILAKACGIDNPIAYVRQHYHPRSVETEEQRAYVNSFDVTRIRQWLFWHGWTKRTLDTFFWWRRN
jgi:hypothetical protein